MSNKVCPPTPSFLLPLLSDHESGHLPKPAFIIQKLISKLPPPSPPMSLIRILGALTLSSLLFLVATVSAQNRAPIDPISGFPFKPRQTPETNHNATAGPKRPASRAENREFVSTHNKIRMVYGEPPLQWDRKLALYARRWAAQRAADCRMIHSYGPYGENIFWGQRDHWTPTQVVESWADEHRFYLADKNECLPGEMCGHFTQIVWRDTLRVGCARQRCNNGGLYVICSYDPPGNYVGENPFINNHPAKKPGNSDN